ncbi:hypothetical protein PINS_up000568 [Pythium insidiosum]|nr:hypothetical protein PINS_up000568 [Pythium insidiosum]
MSTPDNSDDDCRVPIEAYFRRQMTAIGTSAMEQIGLLHVLVVGLRGVGVEIAKCLAQSGVQRLTLLDDELVRQEDFSVNVRVSACRLQPRMVNCTGVLQHVNQKLNCNSC